jgi:MoCo/4Fe-4S cofactor protein with predicted Tat translocation signal
MASNKITFRSIHELKDQKLNAKLANIEFADEIPVEDFLGDAEKLENSSTSRRDFLKLLGFSTAAVTLAACESPVIKSIPYVVKPHSITPGLPNYYASALFDGFDFSNVLVKTREGRPIKIEKNPAAGPLGTTSARAQASVLSLYDNDRTKEPKLDGQVSTYENIDAATTKALATAQAAGKKIVVLSQSYPSPTFKKLFAEFKAKYSQAELVTYDAYNYSAQLEAAQEVFGNYALPVYDLSTSELVVAFNAEFLGDYNAQNLEVSYAAARKPGKNMLRHIQVETNLSLTGSNADTRFKLKPSAVYKTLAEVYKGLSSGTSDKVAAKIVEELKAKGAKAVVFADGNKAAQVLAHRINQKLGSEALVKNQLNYTKEFNAAKYAEFTAWVNAGQVGVLISNKVNPIATSAEGSKLEKGLKAIPFSIAITDKENQTAKLAKVIIPSCHWLESWADFVPQTGVYSLQQPTIQKIYKSRQIEELLLTFTAGPAAKYYDYLKASASSILGSKSFNQALYDGYNAVGSQAVVSYNSGDAAAAVAALSATKASPYELLLTMGVGIGDGTQANNPWLQELPDPVTRMSWDNYLSVSPKDAEKLGIKNDLNGRMQLDGTLVDITVAGKTIKNVPAFIQPGQAEGGLSIHLGYGQKDAGKVATTGINLYEVFDGKNLNISDLSIKPTSEEHQFAGMQLQNTLMGRYEIAKEVSLSDYINKPYEAWNEPLKMDTYVGKLPIGQIDLWDQFDDTDGPHFNLSVDLNSCTGCGACVVACQAENNVAVVGKEEIRMSRDMYWLRIDRYFSSREHITVQQGIEKDLNVPQLYDILDDVADNPDVIFQPVMCQHCNHAPCETVCPVAATSHGKQGQNQMAYNRCIGTRYCANNCPYKVRRFNWFNYALNDKFDFNMNNDLGRMVLNPDVVVRTRGVMEKCSMCIQMTQATILEAKKEGRRIEDGEFQTACSKACSTGSLKFGDMNNKKSEVRALFSDTRRYLLLEEVGAKPNVFYHTKVRNRKEEKNV